VNGPERPRSTQGCGELVIVIGRVLVGMAVERRLDGVIMVLDGVAMLMESEGEDHHTAHGPQQRADCNDRSEITSHD